MGFTIPFIRLKFGTFELSAYGTAVATLLALSSRPVGLNFYAPIIETRRKLGVEWPAAFGVASGFSPTVAPDLRKRELTVEFGWIVCADHNVATDRRSTKNLSAVESG